MEFTGVELAGGVEQVPWRRLRWVRALEKPAVGRRHSGEGGRRAAILWRRRCRPTEWRRDGEGGAVESAVAEAAQRSPITESCG
jgi:hypothetical protein